MTNTVAGPVLITNRRHHDGRVYGLNVETLDFRAEVNYRHPGNRASSYLAKARVFDAVEAFNTPEWSAEEMRLLLETPSGPAPALQAHQKLGIANARLGVLAHLPALLEALRADGLSVEVAGELTVRWNLHAGCSCRCSPGFVVDALIRVAGRPVDVWFERA
jgi:hypothetical protein